MKKNIFQIITIVLIILGNLALLFYWNKKNQTLQEQIISLSQDIESNLNNQTSLFYRVIGESIPVVIPENDKENFMKLLSLIDELKSKQDSKLLSETVKIYMDFIKTTAPWIQEALSTEILNAKYDIDYYSLLVKYKNDNDLDSLIDGLESFILVSNEYSNIQSVITYYNSLVDEQSKNYEIKISQLKEKIKTSLGNTNITSSEILDLLNQCQSFESSDYFTEELKQLNLYLSEALLREQIIDNLEKSKVQLNEISIQDKTTSYTLGIITQNIAECLYNAKTISTIDNKELINETNSLLVKISELQDELKKYEESLLLQDINTSIDVCENELNDLNSDSISSSMISILATQLATLQINLDSITSINISETKNKLLNCKNHLKSKESIISSGLSNEENKQLTTYNKNALQRISAVNKENQEIGTFASEKKSKRISLILKLEEINQNYLYLSVNTLYQQVYQEIWNALDSDSRFEVSKSAINVNKKALDENF